MYGAPASHCHHCGDALPATLMLAFSSLILSIVISVPLGIRAAVKKGTGTDQGIRILSLVGLSFPNFWLALMLVLLPLIVGAIAAAISCAEPSSDALSTTTVCKCG